MKIYNNIIEYLMFDEIKSHLYATYDEEDYNESYITVIETIKNPLGFSNFEIKIVIINNDYLDVDIINLDQQKVLSNSWHKREIKDIKSVFKILTKKKKIIIKNEKGENIFGEFCIGDIVVLNDMPGRYVNLCKENYKIYEILGNEFEKDNYKKLHNCYTKESLSLKEINPFDNVIFNDTTYYKKYNLLIKNILSGKEVVTKLSLQQHLENINKFQDEYDSNIRNLKSLIAKFS